MHDACKVTAMHVKLLSYLHTPARPLMMKLVYMDCYWTYLSGPCTVLPANEYGPGPRARGCHI